MAAVGVVVLSAEFRERRRSRRRLLGVDLVAQLDQQVEVGGGGVLDRHERRKLGAMQVADDAKVEAVGGAGFGRGLEPAFDDVAGRIDEAIEVVGDPA